MAQYKLIKGTHSHIDADGNRVTIHAGDVVELSATQAAAFKDKFKHVVIAAAEEKAALDIAAVEADLKEDKPKGPKVVQPQSKAPQSQAPKVPQPQPQPQPVEGKKPAQEPKLPENKKPS